MIFQVLILIFIATAFVPIARSARSSLKMNFANDEIGILKPVGFFDPLGKNSDNF